MKQRWHHLDALRAWAMLMGIGLHGALAFVPEVKGFWAVTDVRSHELWSVGVMAVHGFRLQVFFVMAGFFAGLLWERRGAQEFIHNRLRRIGLPLLLFSILLLPLMFWQWIVCLERQGWDWQELAESSGIKGEIFAMNFGHLWFLWYLLWLLAGYAAVAWVADRRGWRAPTGKWLEMPRCLILVVPATLPFQWLMRELNVDSPMGIGPIPRLLGYYGVFFAFGALLYARREVLDRVGRWWGALLALGVLVLFPATLVIPGLHLEEFAEGVDVIFVLDALWEVSPGWHFAAVLANVFYTWFVVLGCIGLFQMLAAKDRPWVRYLSDASYWLYLTHLPVLFALQIEMRSWEASGIVKFSLQIAVATGLLLAIYHFAVRNTWLGRMLNGPASQASKPSSKGEAKS